MHLIVNSRDVGITSGRLVCIAAQKQRLARHFPRMSVCQLLLSADACAFTIKATLERAGESRVLTAAGSNLYEAMAAFAR